jgi:hypothetical protein
VERLTSLLLWQVLFTESSCGEQLLALLPFSSVLKALRPLCCMSFSVPCLLFSLGFFFCGARVSPSRRICWFILGVAVGVLCASFLLTCWSTSPRQVRSWRLAVQEPSWFL